MTAERSAESDGLSRSPPESWHLAPPHAPAFEVRLVGRVSNESLQHNTDNESVTTQINTDKQSNKHAICTCIPAIDIQLNS